MINLQKFNRIKVKNEEEFDTVVADLAEQGVTYKGYLPISDEVRADIAKSFRKDFPKYVTLEILNGGVSVTFAKPSTWEKRRWYVTLEEIEELDQLEHVYPVLFTEEEWLVFTDGILNRIDIIERKVEDMENPYPEMPMPPYTKQEEANLVNRLKGNISGFRKAYEVLTTFTSNYKTTFELTMDEESLLTDKLDDQITPLYNQSKSFTRLKHDRRYSLEKLASRAAFIQGETDSLGEVRDTLRAYSQLKIDTGFKRGEPEEKKIQPEYEKIVQPNVQEIIERIVKNIYNPHSYIPDLGRALDKIWDAHQLGHTSVCLNRSDGFDHRVINCLKKEGLTISESLTSVDAPQDVQWTVSWAKKGNEKMTNSEKTMRPSVQEIIEQMEGFENDGTV